jgi:hypothetical protein
MTDKEKKAIYEAMKQIRENRRLQEQRRLSDYTHHGDFDGLPTDVYRGKNNNFVYHNSDEAGVRLASTNNFGPNDTTFMSADPIGRNDPRPMGDNIIFTPDGREITGTGRGSARGGAEETKRREGLAYAKKFGLARVNSTVDGTRFPGSSKGFEKSKTKGTKIKLGEIHGQPPPGARRQAQMRADRADRPSVLGSFLDRTIDRGQDLVQRGTDALGRITGTGKYVLPDMYGRRGSPIVDELKAIAKNPGRAIRRITGNETPMERIQRINAQPYPGKVIMGDNPATQDAARRAFERVQARALEKISATRPKNK